MPDTVALGTRRDVYEEGYSWCLHSMWPKVVAKEDARVTIGGAMTPTSKWLLHCFAPSLASANAVTTVPCRACRSIEGCEM